MTQKMMTSDLRGFLARVREERPSDLLEISREVNPRYETAAILTKLEERQRSPVLWFHKVKGCEWPLVTNVCGSMGRLALALDCPLRLVSERYAAACEGPIPPAARESASVHENILSAAEVDLGLLPALVYHVGDSQNPYITAAIVVARDPETGKSNLSYHRLMIADRSRTGIFIERGKHLDGIYRKYERLGRPMPIAAFIGVHPAVSLGALYSGSVDVEEYDIIGGLMRAPLGTVACVTQPGLFVPADAEMVLEGFVPPHERIEEGPFGEFTGYGTGCASTPVFCVSAMTFRDACLLQDVVSGHLEHLMLPVPAMERRLLADARAVAGGVTRVALVGPLTVVVALEKTDDRQPRAVIEVMLKGDIYTKHVIVVDAGVEPGDLRQVVAAAALNAQAAADVHIFPDEQGTTLDPSCTSPTGRVSKMGIDATRKLATTRRITRNSLPAEVLDAIDVAELLKR
jgi:2,5-furandicarboxylate decarboxylase 1